CPGANGCAISETACLHAGHTEPRASASGLTSDNLFAAKPRCGTANPRCQAWLPHVRRLRENEAMAGFRSGLPYLIWLLLAIGAGAREPVGFDPSPADRLRIYSDAYELTLSKTNGAILGLIDKSANAPLTLGSRNGCLWGSNYQTTPSTY